MFASIPHYRLRGLHEAMMRYPSYRDQAVVVEGYFFQNIARPLPRRLLIWLKAI